MLIKLTNEQLMIQATAREFSRKVIAASAMERDQTGIFPAEILRKMGELGLMGMMTPPEYGGEGSDAISYVLALSEIAYACASTAVIMSVHNSIVSESLAKFGAEEQKRKYFPRLITGEDIGAFALTEAHAGSDPAALSTAAVRDGDCYILNGVKNFISSGKNAGLYIIMAKTDESKRHRGISAFLAPKDTPGLKIGRIEDKMGLRSSDTTDMILQDCRIPATDRLGEEGEGFKIAMQALDCGRIGVAAQSIGVARAALDAAVEYAKQREQFGRKISNFQGLRWMVADMATEIEAAEQLTCSAAAMKDRGEDFTVNASMAKLFASEMANRVVAKALQMHGGYGFIKDYTVERLYRDARVFTIYEGTSEIQRVVIANHIFNDRRR